MKRLLHLLILLIVAPAFLPFFIAGDVWRWFRSYRAWHFDEWRQAVATGWTEVLHPGRAEWEDRRRLASYCNQVFTEPRP